MENNTMNTASNQLVEETQNINSTSTADETVKKQTGIDAELMKELKSTQNLTGAVLGGLLGAAAGAAVWTIITALTNYEIGYTAIAVGFLTGIMVRKFGHGFEKQYGFIGAILSFAGCFLGNILASLIMVSNHAHIPFMTILQSLGPDFIVRFIKESFDGMDLLFYGIALYEGYKFSFITKDELNEKLNKINRSRI